jgi:hypothetical protein
MPKPSREQRFHAEILEGHKGAAVIVPKEAPKAKTQTKTDPALDALFESRDPNVRAIYDELLKRLRKIGPVAIEPKKTSIHLVSGTAFAGVHPRKSNVLLNIKTATALKSPRVRKIEQPSKSRFHNELLLESPRDVDTQLMSWLTEAYKLTAARG